MNRGAILPSQRSDHRTPGALFATLVDFFGPFDLDPCTSPDNPLGTPQFYTAEIDGLQQPWRGRVYVNCPYGRGIDKWVWKAIDSVTEDAGTMVVMLLPARTDTRWWGDAMRHHAEVCWLEGRLHFDESKAGAPFPSVILVFRRRLPTRMGCP